MKFKITIEGDFNVEEYKKVFADSLKELIEETDISELQGVMSRDGIVDPSVGAIFSGHIVSITDYDGMKECTKLAKHIIDKGFLEDVRKLVDYDWAAEEAGFEETEPEFREGHAFNILRRLDEVLKAVGK